MSPSTSARQRAWRTALVIPAVLMASVLLGTTVALAAASFSGSSDRPGVVVPDGFRGASMSWLDTDSALALGTAPCSTDVAHGGSSVATGCTDVVGTSNGGSSWSLVASVSAPLQGGVDAVTDASSKVEWLYAPELWLSTDSGAKWKQQTIPGGGQQVISLVAGTDETYAMVSQCPPNPVGSCLTKAYTVWSTPTAKPGTWTKIATHFTPPAGLDNNNGGLAASGTTVYAFASVESNEGGDVHNYLEARSSDTAPFATRPSPCPTGGENPENLVQVVATSRTHIALLCTGQPSLGHSGKTIYTSKDLGKQDTSAGSPETGGTAGQLAASPSRKLAVTSASGASFIDINDSDAKRWDRVVTADDGGQGWNDIVYVSKSVGWVINAPSTDAYPQAAGALWKTTDAGRKWSVVSW